MITLIKYIVSRFSKTAYIFCPHILIVRVDILLNNFFDV